MSNQCRQCAELRDRPVAGVTWCPDCGCDVTPAPKRRETVMQRVGVAHVERAFSPVTYHQPEGVADMLSPYYPWGVSDLVLLTKWTGAFYGSGLVLREPVQTSGGDGHGREDDKTREWHRVAMVHRRFEAMRTGDGCTHYAVLWFAVFERGGNNAELGKGLMAEIGKHFAPIAQREAWAKHRQHALRESLPRVSGQRLWDAAVKAWRVGA